MWADKEVPDYKGRSLSESGWRHWMETFSALMAPLRGIHRSSQVISPHKGQWLGALIFFFDSAWRNACENNRGAGDLRRHRAHYDATLMVTLAIFFWRIRFHSNERTMLQEISRNHDDVIQWNHFCVTGHLCGEFTGQRWIPHTKGSDA